ncbi:hypothetical protein QE152_g16944 [Popillia japonica]|uniref:Uncharacterized protein n=1 Tax=Popillia japonica TaxID=7064 RepID=A0AAW1L5N5_POPJA
MRSVSVQVSLEDINKELEDKKRVTLKKIKSAMEENDTFINLAGILDEKWTQDIYKVTETGGINATAKIGHDGDYAILIDPARRISTKSLKQEA